MALCQKLYDFCNNLVIRTKTGGTMTDENPYELSSYSEKKSRIERFLNKMDWTGGDIIGESGFGVINEKAYFNTPYAKETERQLVNSQFWKKLTSHSPK